MPHCLIVANQTAADERLVAEVLRRATAQPDTEFFIVVPQTPLSQQERALRHSEHPLAFGETGPVTLARRRLREALAIFTDTAVQISGDIGDANPLKAVAAVMAARPVDQIIVSTLPRRQSRWLAGDLPTKLHRRTGLPVTHVETGAHLGTVLHDGSPSDVAHSTEG